ncbi:hypothetical protein EB169_06540, partial [archaeon]|nr:hypothetical protein [archaeon]
SGNVGIGTASPENKLHVEGSVLINAGTGSGTFNDLNIGGVSGWSSPEAHRINFIYGNAASPDIFTTIESEYVGSSSKLHFRNMYNNASPQTGYVMSILGTGNVGIGTTSPTSALQVGNGTSNSYSTVAQLSGDSGGASILSALSLVNSRTAATGNGVAIDFHTASNYSPTGRIATVTTGAGGVANADLRFYTYNGGLTQQMVLDRSGNLGIGTTSPSQKLDVIGRIRSSFNSGDYFEIGSSDSGGFVVGRSGGTEVVNVRTYGDSFFNGGNFGIGTTGPSQKLHVVGKALITDDVQLTGSNPRIDFNSNGASSLRFYNRF